VSSEPALASELPVLEQLKDTPWHPVSSIAEAETAIQQTPPMLVVLDIAAASQWTDSVEFVRHLATHFP
jgi:hypothetical protein